MIKCTRNEDEREARGRSSARRCGYWPIPSASRWRRPATRIVGEPAFSAQRCGGDRSERLLTRRRRLDGNGRADGYVLRTRISGGVYEEAERRRCVVPSEVADGSRCYSGTSRPMTGSLRVTPGEYGTLQGRGDGCDIAGGASEVGRSARRGPQARRTGPSGRLDGGTRGLARRA